MIKKTILLQNFVILIPFVYLFIINVFQIRRTEVFKLIIFAIFYLVIFNLVRIFIQRYFNLKNSNYFAVVIFYLSLNYSTITIFVYFAAFDFLKIIPNYSFIIFLLFTSTIMYFSTKNIFEKLFEITSFGYLIFILIISFNTLSVGSNQSTAEIENNTRYENIELINKPDIYFIIFDGLPSLKTMEKFYGYDTTEFYNLLENKNLTNYPLSTSSFGRTIYTMSSLFKMDYIFQNGDIPFSTRADSTNSFVLGDTIFENILRSNDYSLYKFGLAFNCNKEKEDVCITQNISSYKEKDSVYYDLIMRTPFKIFIEKGLLQTDTLLSMGCNSGCSDPELTDIFQKIGDDDNPKAVFLHFMDTHGPYLLGDNCRLLDDPIFDLPKTDVVNYRESLSCAYLKIYELINLIDIENDVIYIQSDHGPNYEKMELTDVSELSVNQTLNRYSTFSVSNIKNFCNDIDVNFKTSVNTFIYFINCFSNSKLSLAEVKNFLAFGRVNESVYDVTKIVQDSILLYYE
jgi:hypothetical protein